MDTSPEQAHQRPLDIVVMAAGQGTRMKSRLPKVLHRLAGRSLLSRVLDTAIRLRPRRILVVTGHGAEQVERAVSEMATQPVEANTDEAGMGAMYTPEVCCVRQIPQLGTGHAVQQAAPALAEDGSVLVLNGDVPLVDFATLQHLVAASAGSRLALLTIELADPTGYGRIVRGASTAGVLSHGKGPVQGIVEHKDASPDQRGIREIYTGMLVAPGAALKRWLAGLQNDNAQKEYYLTDIVGLAVVEGTEVVSIDADGALSVAGINSALQLADLERAFQRRQAETLMEAGVRLADPSRFDLRGTLDCGMDVEIDVNCLFEGDVVLGEGVRIGAHCVIANAHIDAGAVIHPFTHIDGEAAGVRVGADARVGPYARLRPGAQLERDVHVGNFVEIKNATLGAGAKANHLAYIGDAKVGERVNFGAGSITANYDGANKHRTVIEDDVHVGSNCVLVAPITLGAGGTVGGGSTLTTSTEPGALTVARARAVSFANWSRPVKKRKE
ncbi:MAG: bifunctional UDP-N-acetylglucosamine diphosphorylase/glucosamine-1-phosphate N-acetyltransferase GlmU [Variovorax sp.]